MHAKVSEKHLRIDNKMATCVCFALYAQLHFLSILSYNLLHYIYYKTSPESTRETNEREQEHSESYYTFEKRI